MAASPEYLSLDNDCISKLLDAINSENVNIIPLLFDKKIIGERLANSDVKVSWDERKLQISDAIKTKTKIDPTVFRDFLKL